MKFKGVLQPDAVFPQPSLDIQDDVEICDEAHTALAALRAGRVLDNEKSPHHLVRTLLVFFVDVVAAYSNLSHPHKTPDQLRKIFKSAQAGVREKSPDPPEIREIRRRLGANVVAEIVEAYRSGSSVRQLAKAHGTSTDAMLRLLKKEGISPRYQSVTDEQVAEIIRLYESGKSIYSIQAELGVPRTSAWNALKRAGVQMSPRGGSRT